VIFVVNPGNSCHIVHSHDFAPSSLFLIVFVSQNEKNDIKAENDVDFAMDFSIKHPLQNCWTLWYYENDRSQTWEKNQKEIASFQTVEDFWRYL
jgi:hypothetical protein